MKHWIIHPVFGIWLCFIVRTNQHEREFLQWLWIRSAKVSVPWGQAWNFLSPSSVLGTEWALSKCFSDHFCQNLKQDLIVMRSKILTYLSAFNQHWSNSFNALLKYFDHISVWYWRMLQENRMLHGKSLRKTLFSWNRHSMFQSECSHVNKRQHLKYRKLTFPILSDC